MSSYNYLSDALIHSINACVVQALNSVSITEPPVNYDLLYESHKLIKQTLTTEEFRGENLISPSELEKVRGILLVKEKRVFVVDNSNYQKRHNFVNGHELGHYVLPHHRALLFKCTQFDLSQSARKQLEREANFFAGELGFMGKLFFQYLQSSKLSLKTIKDLSDRFMMSIEATLRRTVEIETRPCVFLSLNLNESDEERFLSVRYAVHSSSFLETVGEINSRHVFSRDHTISQIITDPISNAMRECECNLTFKGQKEVPLHAELWRNDWNIFVLIQPIQ